MAVAAGGLPVGDRFGAVEIDPADVGLVAQQPRHGEMTPGGLPGWGSHLVGVEPAADLAAVSPLSRSVKIRRTTAASGSKISRCAGPAGLRGMRR